jgi:rod shape-determining protein MreC
VREIGRRGQPGAERATIIILVIAGFVLLLVGRTEPEVFDGIKQRVADLMAPMLSAASGPIGDVRDWRRQADDMMSVYEDNKKLRAENEQLRIDADRARRLQSLIERYQALLNVKVDPSVDYLTARIIGDSGGPFSRSVLVNAGKGDNVKAGQGVVDPEGLLGHVVSVGDSAARILLLTDVESHIPVVIEPGTARAILTGDGKDQAMIEHLPPGTQPKAGNRIVTSGVAGLLPPGILVGTVEKVDGSTNAVEVKLASSFDRLDVVRILRYDASIDTTVPDPAAAPRSEGPAQQPLAQVKPATPPAAQVKPATPPRPATPPATPPAPTARATPAPAPAEADADANRLANAGRDNARPPGRL